MQKLRQILKDVKSVKVTGPEEIVITGIELDSRAVKAGMLFAAIAGSLTDGHNYIEQAIKNGAIAVLVSKLPEVLHENVTYLLVSDTSEALGLIAHAYYEYPSRNIVLVGVTGTNGKTTIATLLFKLFRELGYSCGLISTVQNQVNDEVLPSERTTPDAVNLNKLMNDMVEAGCSHVFMECSSHAIHQNRIAGLEFNVAIFSNITHDHLDYHHTFNEYIKAKKKFFDDLPATAYAISNIDDKRGVVMLQNTKATRLYYGLKNLADFKGRIIENSLTGLLLNINNQEVHCRLIGEFNAYNLLAVYGAALSLNEPAEKVLVALSNLTGAEGRFEYYVSVNDKIIGIVDYAHTPDALLNVLTTIKELRNDNEEVITVVGCGGDRDKTKRPAMTEVACEYSSKVIITSDNPRSENPVDILDDMQAGLKSEHKRKLLVIEDRKQAIRTATMLSQPGGIILIAGKGHEKYQEINGVKHHFDDKEELLEAFQTLSK
ncbi:UDP-N-acetylmuramoyl-L-alanyl-D-glutamate--2,6-diaminopimelate ligase [Polluticaenibacter yanchengensis]|uniref:UDP-N-acetylmuramoyl-L-alanyl-D-glutamate--2,6-diaminopimelate ligase n=1 Tax=Polluticaenibacter yanchengensis TaxID=3014562 RepID=A0ABT4UFN4_9BACT|nr:UDP-N-acetylmuramoyl-L-alanyl-D-glutamate--2,6-diaminopimelate ligase [Chitinophagaceae bacterium LY-5]